MKVLAQFSSISFALAALEAGLASQASGQAAAPQLKVVTTLSLLKDLAHEVGTSRVCRTRARIRTSSSRGRR